MASQICLSLIAACGGRHLEYIDRSHGRLENVPEDVLRNSRTLEECNLEANAIGELPKNFFRMGKLQKLILRENELCSIPSGFGNFIHLVHLDLSENHISEISPNIKGCENLIYLDLSKNNFEKFPDGITSLHKLKVFYYCENNLLDLPPDFGNLQKLEKLELRDNCLQSLPTSIAQLQQLQLLDIGTNMFCTMPMVITSLTALQELYIDSNELKELPNEICRLSRLQRLDVSTNTIDCLPLTLSGLFALKDLYLHENHLDQIPDAIGDLKSLNDLQAAKNQIVVISSKIGKCTQMKELVLSENKLTKIPDEISQLVNLQFLALDRNRLTEIPKRIGKCVKLEILLLRDNLIRVFPDEVGNLNNLRVLDVAANKLSRLPVTLLQCQNLSSLWLSTNQSNSAVRLQEEKDSQTKRPFLTCYLLPQDAFNPESVENISHLPDDAYTRSIGEMDDGRHSLISMDGRNRHSYVDDDGRKVRIHFDKKAVDGHVIPKDESQPKETTFAPGRASPPPTNDHSTEDNLAELRNSMMRKTSAPPISRNSMNMAMNHNSSIGGGGDRSSQPQQQQQQTRHSSAVTAPIIGGVPVRRPPPAAGGGGSNLTTISSSKTNSTNGQQQQPAPQPRAVTVTKKPNNNSDEGSSTEVDDESSNSSSAASTPKAQPKKMFQISQAPVEVIPPPPPVASHQQEEDEEEQDGDDDEEELEEEHEEVEATSSGAEEVDSIARRVGFCDEVEDNEAKSSADLKLTRRDTPHYTKKARINSKTEDGIDGATMVIKILEKYRSSSGSEYGNVPMEIPIGGGGELLNDNEKEEQIHIHISRPPKTGLGISIAGGLGSVAYRGKDQGIFISKCSEDKPAYQCGLRTGDKLYKVNGHDMLAIEHQQAVEVLRHAGNEIDMQVGRIVPQMKPNNLSNKINNFTQNENISCCIRKDENGWGFSIAGGKGSLGNEGNFDESIYVSKIIPAGAAEHCHSLQVSDKIVKINGIDVSQARHEQAVNLLTTHDKPELYLQVVREISYPFQFGQEEIVLITANKTTTTTSKLPSSSLELFGLEVIYSQGENRPFSGEAGIFITKIEPNSPAALTNHLRFGDRILSINQQIADFDNEDDIVTMLTSKNTLELFIRHEPSPPGFLFIGNVNKSILSTGLCFATKFLKDLDDSGVFITRILSSSLEDLGFSIGQRLLQLNGHSLLNNHNNDSQLICKLFNKSIENSVNILLCNGITQHDILQSTGVVEYFFTGTKPPSQRPARTPVSVLTSKTTTISNSNSPSRPSNIIADDNNTSNGQRHNAGAELDRANLSFRSKIRLFNTAGNSSTSPTG